MGKAASRWLKRGLKAAVAAGILGVLIHQSGGRKVLDTAARLDWRLFAASVVAYCLMQALKTHRLQVLLRAVRVSVSFFRLLLIYFIGMFFNTVLPTLVGGDAVRVAYLYRETGKFHSAAAPTIVERLLGTAALILMALVALPLSSAGDADPRLITSVLLVTAGFVVGILFLFSPWAYRIGTAVMRRVGLGKVEHVVAEMQEAMADYRRRAGVLAYAMFLSVIANLIMVGIHAMLAHGLGLRLSAWFLLTAVPVTVLISMAPVTISGLGVRELTWVFLLNAQGVSEADAVTLSLLWFAVTTVASLLGGPAFLVLGKPPVPTQSVAGVPLVPAAPSSGVAVGAEPGGLPQQDWRS